MNKVSQAYASARLDAEEIIAELRQSACSTDEERDLFDIAVPHVLAAETSMEGIVARHQDGEDLFTTIVGHFIYCYGMKLGWMAKDRRYGESDRWRFSVAAKTMAPFVERLRRVLLIQEAEKASITPPTPSVLEECGWADPWAA